MSIAFGLIAALCWGTSDFAAKISSERIGALRTALFLQYVGGLILVLVVAQDIPRVWQFPTATYFTLGLGAINAAAAFSLFKGFEVGQLSIISPIASSYPALSTVLAVMLLNETVSQTRFAAILAILVGIVLVSVQRRHPKTLDRRRLAAGVGYAIVAFLALGFTFFALKFVVGELGAFLPVFLVRLMSAIILTGVVILTPKARSRGNVPKLLRSDSRNWDCRYSRQYNIQLGNTRRCSFSGVNHLWLIQCSHGSSCVYSIEGAFGRTPNSRPSGNPRRSIYHWICNMKPGENG